MKKIIIATALILTTGVLSSQVKVNNNPKISITVQNPVSSERKELASGD
jgi:hypothetical protein